MEEKIVKMVIYYVLAVYEDDEKNIEGCIKVAELFLMTVENEEDKLDYILKLFPEKHPVYTLYSEIKDISKEELITILKSCKEKFNNYKEKNIDLKEIKDEKELEELCKNIVKFD